MRLVAADPVPSMDLAQIRARADQADPDAQNTMGNAYTNGLGVKQDYATALNWYHQAAEKGYGPAQFNLGLVYELGRGVDIDERQAFKFYLMAAEQGFGPAQFNVGNMYSAGRGVGQDLFEANLWYKQAAEKGITEAQFNLGLAYETGRGVRKDEVQAARWYKQAADRGFARAQYNLGLLLEDGHGVPKNEATAATLYRAAADQGFAAAQNNYGVMLAEGRGGLTKDPVQAYVWLSLAAQNGSSPAARDFVAKNLSPDQLGEAERLLAERKTASPASSPAVAASTPLRPETVVVAPAPSALTEAGQRGDSAKLIGELRAQNRRLSEQVQALTADKETAESQANVLSTQIKDMRTALDQQKNQPAAPAGDSGQNQKELAALSARLDESVRSLNQVKLANQQLTAENNRLLQEKAAAAAVKTLPTTAADDGKTPVSIPGGSKDAIITNLQRDNARLNDEVKRSTRELMSLNQQVRNLRAQSGKPATATEAAPGGENLASQLAAARSEVTRLTAEVQRLNATQQSADAASDKLDQATKTAARLQAENGRLTARVAELEKSTKPAADPAQLAAAQQTTTQLQQQVQALQGEKADLDKWARSLEQTLNEQTAKVKTAEAGAADLGTKLALAQQQLTESKATLAAQQQAQEKLTTENHALTDRANRAEKALAEQSGQKPDSGALDALRQQVAEAQAQAAKQAGENQALATKLAAEHDNFVQAQAKAATLENSLHELEQKKSTATAGVDNLTRQLADANQALEKSGATVAELTAENDRLGKELAATKQGATDSAALRDELTKLRRGAADLTALRDENARLRKAVDDAGGLQTKNEQLTHDSEQMAALLANNRADLSKAQARIAELEKQPEAIPTVSTHGGEDMKKLRADLTEANQSIEKLNATVADLTGANDKLEKDLDNAKKSTEAALAAQSQAVSAAQPDAYKMEIGTLQAHVKELESQIEEERGNAAKEVSTMAAQLQRTRETNRSLTEANRALLSAKDNETAATQQDQEQLQAKVRELTAAGEEQRRLNQHLTEEAQKTEAERDALKAQLEEARKTATALPGLSDEKKALQERLEAVGAQLLKTQQDLDAAQKGSTDLTAQLTASKQAADKAQSDLTAMQTRATEAEKATEAHGATVAELTQANAKLELEHEDMRRLVESYRADIARLTQSVRSAEQQRTDAERSGQQNIDAVTAQLAQLRRELDSARTAQSRQIEASAAQDRDRVAIINQLRSENAAQAARLTQAQGTLDQIAAAARLGTPASAIASGSPVPVAPIPTVSTNAPLVRYHTVAEGDSLSRISMRYYGTPNRWQDIFQANRDVLQGSSVLRVGMQLKIP